MMSDLFGETAPIAENTAEKTIPGGAGFVRARELLRGTLADQALTNAVAQDRLGSALMFHGPEGSGKWAAALLLATALNSPDRDVSSILSGAHGFSPSAAQIFGGTFPELLWAAPTPSSKKETEQNELIAEFLAKKKEDPLNVVRWEKASGISIERARTIRRRLALKPNAGTTRVVIFYQVEKMLPAALDALLRMIEEPAPSTIFVLITNQLEAVAPTAVSRCQRVRFPGFSTDKIDSFLAQATDLTENQRRIAARLAQGSAGRALTIAHEMTGADPEQNSDRELSWLTFKSLLLESGSSSLEIVFSAVNLRNRSSVALLLERWQSYVRDLTLLGQGLQDQVANVDLLAEFQRIVSAKPAPSGEALYQLVDRFDALRVNLRHNVGAPLALADLSFAIRTAFVG